MSQGTRRRNAGLITRFQPPKRTSEAPPPVRLWPTSNPDHAVLWWRMRLDKPLFVYFMRDERGPLKIGKALDPTTRLTELQCGNPAPIKLAAVVLAAANTERRLHTLWNRYHLQGEWFAGETQPGISTGILELATRAQRQQIEAFKRNKLEFDIAAMPVEIIDPAANISINSLVKF